MSSFFCMPFLACNRQIDSYDRRQCNLHTIPPDVERYSRTLEEILLDCNHIKELPKFLFRCHKLRRLSLGDNDIYRLMPEIAQLNSLVELNLGKNDISDIPEELKHCKLLQILDLSSNPITRLPATITQLPTLTKLILNDVSLTVLPNDIGHLVELRDLEMRENLIRALPASLSQLVKLQVLDIGQNELDQLPREMGNMVSLREFYVDSNDLEVLPDEITKCHSLDVLDVSENKIRKLPEELGALENLTDLNVSNNCLDELPHSIGRLKKLVILKAEKNAISQLSQAIGSCSSLEEMQLTSNNLSELPSSIGNLVRLKCLNVDQNQLTSIPSTIGGCSSLAMLSLRENQLAELPMDIGKCERLTVLDLCANRLSFLPFTINVLFKLQALWLSENQSQAMLKLQQERDPRTGVKVLTCYLLPQHNPQQSTEPERSTSKSFVGGPKVHFGDMNSTADEEKLLPSGNFERHGTPHPKPHAAKLKKNTIDGHIIHHDDDMTQPKNIVLQPKRSTDNTTSSTPPNGAPAAATSPQQQTSLPRSALRFQAVPIQQFVPEKTAQSSSNADRDSGTASGSAHSSQQQLNNYQSPNLNQSLDASLMSETHDGTSLSRETISTSIRRDVSGSPGFTIAGGTGAGREGFFISQITPGGSAAIDGKLQVGDKILSINGTSLRGARHDQAVALLTGHTDNEVYLVVQRERPSLTSPLPQTLSPTSYSQPTLVRAPSRSAPLNLLGDTSLWDNTEDEVELIKDGNSLGLSVVGGKDHASHPFGIKNPGVFISKIAINSPASRSGRLRIGDRILEVNGKDISDAKHIEAVEALKNSQSKVRLRVRHDPQPAGLKEIIIVRRENGALGISIHGGVDSTKVNPADSEDEGIFIDRVEAGSVSDAAGLIAGQRIIEVNGESLLGCKQDEAASILRRHLELKMLVCDGYNRQKSSITSPPSGSSIRASTPTRDENSLDEIYPPAASTSPPQPLLPLLNEAPLATSSPLPPSNIPRPSRIPPPVAPKPTLKASQVENIRAPVQPHEASPEHLNFSSKLQKFEREIETKTTAGRSLSGTSLPPPEKKPLLSQVDLKKIHEEETRKLQDGLPQPDILEGPKDDTFFNQLIHESDEPQTNGRSMIPVLSKKTEVRAIAAGQLFPESYANEADKAAAEQEKRSQWRAARLKSIDQERAAVDVLMSRLQIEAINAGEIGFADE